MLQFALSAGTLLRAAVVSNLAALFAAFFYKAKWRNWFNAAKNVPSLGKNALQTSWYFLTALIGRNKEDSSQSILAYFEANSYLFQKQGIWKYWLYNRPVVILSKPETAQILLNSEVNIEKSYDYKFFRPLISNGLATSCVSQWKTRRKMIVPTLHARVIEGYLPIFDEQSRVLVRKIKEFKGKACDFLSLAFPCTLDIMCETSMGIDLKAQKEGAKEYVDAVYTQLKICSKRILKAWLWPDFLFQFSSLWKCWEKSVVVTTTVVSCMVKQRKKELLNLISQGISLDGALKALHRRLCFLDLLLELHICKKELSLEDIIDEVNTLIYNGHDTSALALTFALYLIGLDPKVQNKIHQEMDSIFESNIDLQIGPEQLAQMKYSECVIKEALRLFPPVPMVGRQLTEDLTINGVKVEKDTDVHVFLYGVHRDPEAYPNPELFNPDRFLPGNSEGRNQFSYVPFSQGPRNCIGSKFAMEGLKTMLANVMRNFSIQSTQPRDKIVLSYDIVIRPKGGMWLKFLPKPKR